MTVSKLLLAGTALSLSLAASATLAAGRAPGEPFAVAQAAPGEAPARPPRGERPERSGEAPDPRRPAEVERRQEQRQERVQERQERQDQRQERAQDRVQDQRQQRAQEPVQRPEPRPERAQEQRPDRLQEQRERVQERQDRAQDPRQDRLQEQRQRAQEQQRERVEDRRSDPQDQRRERVQDQRQDQLQDRRERVEDRQEFRQDRARDVQDNRQDRTRDAQEFRQDRARDQQEFRQERARDAQENRQDRVRDAQEFRQDRVEDRQEFRQRRVEELRRDRRERVEDGGRRTVIEEPGRLIVREGSRVVIRSDETERFRRSYRGADVRTERRGAEQVTVVRRPNGVEIVTIRDADGDLVRRIRRERGREVVLIENVVRGAPPRRAGLIQTVVELAPVRLAIPREKYVVEVDRASRDDLYEAFTAPPVERVERAYTLDEVRQSRSLRERVRRVDIDTITFASGAWDLEGDEAAALTGVAEAIRRAIERNPNEIFLIEGHTDAVGPDVDNLTLSDRRAETVATVLTERFEVPAENLTTQGYGEQYLKIATEEPERANRRVTVRRVTPLLRGSES